MGVSHPSEVSLVIIRQDMKSVTISELTVTKNLFLICIVVSNILVLFPAVTLSSGADTCPSILILKLFTGWPVSGNNACSF